MLAANKLRREPSAKSSPNRPRKPTRPAQLTCNNCGRTGHRSRDPTCPANGKNCNACEKANHFSSVCRSKPLPQRQSNNKLKALRNNSAAVHMPFHHTIELLSGARYVTFSAEVDTGAEISGVTENFYRKNFQHLPLLPPANL
ncbi:enzymatic polyprotein [Elysia marginata]|uniref:Enzymatic polyprotein n=1 Tax=Elysia marginata TaxID=1093978 RepID=A0AAV4GEK7_9GAST|nr:enzymatic polyprotein [Elysia marginata]